MSELEKTQLELHKAWDLIDKLEDENLQLTIASRNHLTNLENKKKVFSHELKNRNDLIGKLRHDNKFLRLLIKQQNSIDPAFSHELKNRNDLIGKLRHDNKFLRLLIKQQNSIDPAMLGTFLKDMYDNMNNQQEVK